MIQTGQHKVQGNWIEDVWLVDPTTTCTVKMSTHSICKRTGYGTRCHRDWDWLILITHSHCVSHRHNESASSECGTCGRKEQARAP